MAELSSRDGGDRSGHYFSLPQGSKLFEFEIERALGHGGFGITYLATDTMLQEPVAIKEYLPNDIAVRVSDSTVCPKSSGDGTDFKAGLKAFLEEARLVARIRHPNVIRVRRFFEFHGTGYIVQDFEDGVTLGQKLREGAIPETHVRQLLSGVLDGLQAVHERAVLHRDLKPNNIMLRPSGVPVLIDFGAARDFGSRHSRSVTAIATPGYTPPEQFGVGGQQGPWTDLYALGAILYRCVTGEAPVDSLRRLRSDPLIPAAAAAGGKYDPKLLALIDWMLRIDETDRPASVQEVRSALADGVTPERGGTLAPTSPLSIRPAGAGHVLLEFEASTRADVLELAFYANPPGRYLSVAENDKPAWRDQPEYIEFYRTGGTAGRATFAVGPQIVNAIPVQSRVTLSSADGFIHASAAWTGVPSAPTTASKSRRWHWRTAAALFVAAVSAAVIGLYTIHQRETVSFTFAGDNVEALRNYLRECRFCSYRSQAEDRIAQFEEQRVSRLKQELQKADSNLAALKTFLLTCGTTCPENLQRQATASIEAINKKQEQAQQEAATYKTAHGNVTALKNYLSSCTACTFADDARRELTSIQRQQENMIYNAARGTHSSLQEYVNSCTFCELAQAAREEITYLTARGSATRLQDYLTSCSVCEFGAAARAEVASIQRSESPVAQVKQQCPNLGGNPLSGTVSLSEFFEPDPARRRVSAGGAQNLSLCNSSWRGWVSGAPDLQLQYRTSGGTTLSISVQSSIDTVILIRDPRGNWHFDDDSGQGLNGRVRIPRAPDGSYEIWVGTYARGRGNFPSMQVLISEN